MASHYYYYYYHHHNLLFAIIHFTASLLFISQFSLAENASNDTLVYRFPCDASISICNASLYHSNNDLTTEQLASIYSVNASQIKPFGGEDRLITVPCTCSPSSDNFSAYFYDVTRRVEEDETFLGVSTEYFNGQAWTSDPNQNTSIDPGSDFTFRLVCGCVEKESQTVVTYTVRNKDTLSSITALLPAKLENVESLNKNFSTNPNFVEPGWVFFVPMEKNGLKSSNSGFKHKWEIALGVLLSVTVLSTGALVIIVVRRKGSKKNVDDEEPRELSKAPSSVKSHSLQRQFGNKERRSEGDNNAQKKLSYDLVDVTGFESERPVVFGVEEIEEATFGFDETKKIGEGGFGSVYFGILGQQEIAVKKMRSNKSKEFFAELKVLCKIHHINVVELLGYACGDDHLYLVYEFIQNGSLSDHLHDPLLKGHQPLSWTARTHIALGTAKGIEYIHDHTKARYVHRDIKTSNILLDECLRAKVADFGLVKLVGRANEDDSIATRLVGTPGYLPPESVKELQVTPKTDVFAFGVVLAELITGKRALIRDNREPTKMKSLITIVKNIFQDEDPISALEEEVDGNLRDNYPIENVFKMAEVAESCLSEEAVDRPEMRDIVVTLNQIAKSSTEWEASLGGNSQVFSGIFNGR